MNWRKIRGQLSDLRNGTFAIDLNNAKLNAVGHDPWLIMADAYINLSNEEKRIKTLTLTNKKKT